MKKIFLYILITFLHCFDLSAQSGKIKLNGKIVYERVLSFDKKPESRLFSLYLSAENSIFYDDTEQSNETSTLTPSPNDESDMTFNLKLNGCRSIVVTELDKDSITRQVSMFKDGRQNTYLVSEKINQIIWDIVDEYKVINDFKAQKAIGMFRGRKYTAWFTDKIPTKYGPWKLNGLPGLILYVSDDKNEVAFIVKTINIPFDITSDMLNNLKFEKPNKKITLEQLVKLESEEAAEFIKLFVSKLPRGATFEPTSVMANEIELEYEFVKKK